MLGFAFLVLLVAAVLGALLALGFLRAGEDMPAFVTALRPHARGLGLVHGSLAGAGFLLLLAALKWADLRPPVGAEGFGHLAAWLVGAALLVGLVILIGGYARRGKTALLLALHAGIAISGVVVLMARVLLG